MNPHPIMGDLLADDLLLDRLGTRTDVSGDPVVPLLAALARHADLPLRGARAPRRFVKRRTLAALTAFVVGASGVGVAAALSGPDRPEPRWIHRMADPDGILRVVPIAPGGVAGGAPAASGAGSATSGSGLVEDATRAIAVTLPRVIVTLVPTAMAGEPPALVASAAGSEAPAGTSIESVRGPVGRAARVTHARGSETTEPSLATDDPKAGGKPQPDPADASGSAPIMTLAGVAPQPAAPESGPPGNAATQHGKPRPDEGDATADEASSQSSTDTPRARPATKPSAPAEPAHALPLPVPARPEPQPKSARAPRPTELPVTVDVAPQPAARPAALPEVAAGATVTGATVAPVPVAEVPPAG